MASVNPMTACLGSSSEVASIKTAKGSKKTVHASSKETPCFARLLLAFSESQTKYCSLCRKMTSTIYVYILYIHTSRRFCRLNRGVFFAFYLSGDAYGDSARGDGFGGETEGSEHGVFAYVGSGEDSGVVGDAGMRA